MSIRSALYGTVWMVAFLVSGCAVHDTRPTGSTAATAADKWKDLNPAIGRVSAAHWFRDSPEYNATARTVYGAARARLDLIKDPCAKTGERWAVVMDADETLLDNSVFQVESIVRGTLDFDKYAWNEWVHRSQETTVPGAKDFVDAVVEKCGVIVVVTNRRTNANTDLAYDECALTSARLIELFGKNGHSPFAALLCRTTEVGGTSDGDKNARFSAVENGNVVGAVTVKMYIGDSITDFPGFTSCSDATALAGADANFGTKYFVLPNPTYGGWTGCPARPL